MVESVAGKYSDRLKTVKINVQDNLDLAIKYGIMAVPNLLFFKGGQVAKQLQGFQNETVLSGEIDKVLS